MHEFWPHVLSFPRLLDPVSWFWLSSRGYAFTSSGLTIPVALLVWLRKHNCHVKRCWRLQWHSTAAGDLVCRHHHPHGQKTHAQVLADHQAAADPKETH